MIDVLIGLWLASLATLLITSATLSHRGRTSERSIRRLDLTAFTLFIGGLIIIGAAGGLG